LIARLVRQLPAIAARRERLLERATSDHLIEGLSEDRKFERLLFLARDRPGATPDSAWCGRLEPAATCTASTALSELGCHESIPALSAPGVRGETIEPTASEPACAGARSSCSICRRPNGNHEPRIADWLVRAKSMRMHMVVCRGFGAGAGAGARG